jgi:hypothetical protein
MGARGPNKNSFGPLPTKLVGVRRKEQQPNLFKIHIFEALLVVPGLLCGEGARAIEILF